MRRARLLALGFLAALGVAGPATAGVVSQGALRIGADTFWSRGLSGLGETVVVMDLAFHGLDASIAAGELPARASMEITSFDDVFGIDGRSPVGEVYEHGVRMAEIVHDIAPDAKLVLVNYRTQAQFEQAVDWVIANGYPIVTHSNSFLTGPHDGTGRAARAVDRAAAAGVLWVNSAGNYGQRHWAGRLTTTPVVFPLVSVPSLHYQFAAGFRGVPASQVELVIERRPEGGEWAEVARSAIDPDAEARVDGYASILTPILRVDQGEWRLLARTVAGAVDAEIFSRTVTLGGQAVADGSAMTPGDARGALSVGAIRWTGSVIEPYSSRGPTDDGRVKPDLVAPTYVTSNPAWPGTAGTSASAPHAAAAAALIRQERQATAQPVTVDDLRAAIVSRTLDLGAPGPDNTFGNGMLRLDTTPPTPTVLIGPGDRPLVQVRAADDGTLAGVVVRYAGKVVARSRRARAAVRLPSLAPRANLEVVATDLAGNAARKVATLRRGRR